MNVTIESSMDEINKAHSDMVGRLAKPGEDILKSLTPNQAHLWHMLSCIMGELGELLEPGSDAKEEIGDIEFYLRGVVDGMKNIPEEDWDESDLTDKELLDLPVYEKFQGQIPRGMAAVISAAFLFDVFKKHIIYGAKINRLKVGIAVRDFSEKVLGGIYSFVGQGFPEEMRKEVLLDNMEKLEGANGRYKEGKYSDEAARNRADKQD